MARRIVLLTFLAAMMFTGCQRPDAPTGVLAPPATIVTRSGVEMVCLPGGEFLMGSERGNPDETPPHKVRLSAFLMDRYPVTHEMFVAAEMPNPSHWQDNPRKPIERVRWRDAKRYCNERSLLEGLKPCYNERTPEWDCDYAAGGYRLPTEAEWEYAARAGTNGPYDFGAADKLRQYGWFAENSEQKTHPVGQKRPNGWGLHELYGNVSQWCEDVYAADYYRSSPAVDPAGPPSVPGHEVKRVLRGGNWKAGADTCRATCRQGEAAGGTDACFSTDFCGFRCVRRVTAQQLAELQKEAKGDCPDFRGHARENGTVPFGRAQKEAKPGQ
jgi:eukaryotic-like serine/threonine-protein kinase